MLVVSRYQTFFMLQTISLVRNWVCDRWILSRAVNYVANHNVSHGFFVNYGILLWVGVDECPVSHRPWKENVIGFSKILSKENAKLLENGFPNNFGHNFVSMTLFLFLYVIFITFKYTTLSFFNKIQKYAFIACIATIIYHHLIVALSRIFFWCQFQKRETPSL